MARTKVSGQPIETVKPTRTKKPVPPEKHVPGFINHPPAHCQGNKMGRWGMVCVDVLSCKMYCNDPYCDAVDRYLKAAEPLKGITK